MSENASAPVGLNSFMARVAEWITGKDARLTQLETEVANLAAIKNQLADANAALDKASAKVAELQSQVSKLTEENKALAAKATISEEEVNKRLNTLVGQRLSSIGVTPVSEKLSSEPNDQGSLVDQFRAETDPDKRAALYARIKTELWGIKGYSSNN